MAGLSIGLTKLAPTRSASSVAASGVSISQDGMTYTSTGPKLLAGTTAILYSNGSPVASTIVPAGGVARWNLSGPLLGGSIITVDATLRSDGGKAPSGLGVALWTPAQIPDSQKPYEITINSAGVLVNAAGVPLTPGPVGPQYVANGPRGVPAMDFGVRKSSAIGNFGAVPAGYYVIVDMDTYSIANSAATGRYPGDYGYLFNGDLNGGSGNRPYMFLKNIGVSASGGYNLTGGSANTSFKVLESIPTESAVALLVKFGADGSNFADFNGDRRSSNPGENFGTLPLSGLVIGSAGTQDYETGSYLLRRFVVFTGSEADALRYQGWMAWNGGYQRLLHPSHPYKFGPPLADGSARTMLPKPGTARRRSVYTGYAGTANVQQWATAMGLALPKIANDHGDYSSWANMLSSGQNVANVYSAAGYTDLIMTVPIAVTGTTLSQSAAGTGDTEFTSLINYYKSKFAGRRVYRLGHEPNVGKFPWSPATTANGTVADYLAAFARKAAIIRAADPAALIAWNPATGQQNIAWTSLIPPAAQFDIVGSDAYNASKGSGFDSMTGWNRFSANVMNTSLLGLEQMILLAERLQKPIAIYEYGNGVNSTTIAAPQALGGDDAAYPGFMATVMRGGSGVVLGNLEVPCVDDSPYESTEGTYNSRTYLSSPPQASAPSDAKDQKPLSAAAFKVALNDTGLITGPVYIKTVTESRAGSVKTTPVFPDDRIVNAEFMAFWSLNTDVDPHSVVFKGTANLPDETNYVVSFPLDDNRGVRGFGFVNVGNYTGSAKTIPAVHVVDVASLMTTWDYTYTQSDQAINLTIDGFLHSTGAGLYEQIVMEWQVYLDCPKITKEGFLDGLKARGGKNGLVGVWAAPAIPDGLKQYATPAINWEVTYEAVNGQGVGYIQMRAIDASGNTLPRMLKGSFDQKAMFDWLRAQHPPGETVKFVVDPKWFFTGYGVGFELLRGTLNLTLNKLRNTYTLSANAGQSASNLFSYPNDASEPDWTKEYVTIANAGTATEAIMEKADATARVHDIKQDFVKPQTAQTYQIEFDVFTAAASGLGRSLAQVQVFNDSYSGGTLTNFNTATPGIGQNYGYGGMTISGAPTITANGDGSFHCTVKVATDASPAIHVLLGPALTDDGNGYVADGTKGIRLINRKITKIAG